MVLSAQKDSCRPAVERRESAVRTVELSKQIDGRSILDEISLDISAGRFVVILGANGAGKSTLLKILATLMTPTSGQLHLFGKPAHQFGTQLRARIGLIDHQPMLYRELSALENLQFFGRLYELSEPADRAAQVLERVGLADRAGDRVKTLSRGMVQRVCIARALLHDPDLLLADEPFTGLDAPSAAMLEELLGQLHSAGKTILMVHHDIAQGLRLAEQAVVLCGGRVVIDRPTRQLDLPTALRKVCPA